MSIVDICLSVLVYYSSTSRRNLLVLGRTGIAIRDTVGTFARVRDL